jgi:hypothetical protein
MGTLATPLLAVLFLAGAVVTWGAGISLSKTTDALDVRFGLGEELGGLILLAFAGTLPEVAITVSAAVQGNLSLAAGNLIGGIAIQTLVLVVCDAAAGPERPLTFLVGALTPVLEAMLVVLVVAGVGMGALLPRSIAIGGVVSPASVGIVVTWVAGVSVINWVRKNPAWSVTMPGARPGRRHRRDKHPDRPHPFARWSTTRIAGLFAVACAAEGTTGTPRGRRPRPGPTWGRGESGRLAPSSPPTSASQPRRGQGLAAAANADPRGARPHRPAAGPGCGQMRGEPESAGAPFAGRQTTGPSPAAIRRVPATDTTPFLLRRANRAPLDSVWQMAG